MIYEKYVKYVIGVIWHIKNMSLVSYVSHTNAHLTQLSKSNLTVLHMNAPIHLFNANKHNIVLFFLSEQLTTVNPKWIKKTRRLSRFCTSLVLKIGLLVPGDQKDQENVFSWII